MLETFRNAGTGDPIVIDSTAVLGQRLLRRPTGGPLSELHLALDLVDGTTVEVLPRFCDLWLLRALAGFGERVASADAA